MIITEVRINLAEDDSDHLRAFVSVNFDDSFVVKDMKIIEGRKGLFVAMPDRRLTDCCPECDTKNHLRARFCNECGIELDEDRATRDADGRLVLYADIAHPINSTCREFMETEILKAYEQELERFHQTGYIYDQHLEAREILKESE